MAVFSALQGGRYIGFVPEKAASAMLTSQDLTRIGSIEVSVRYWIFALRNRELEPFASRVAKAASSP
jgi:hypothetical protein